MEKRQNRVKELLITQKKY